MISLPVACEVRSELCCRSRMRAAGDVERQRASLAVLECSAVPRFSSYSNLRGCFMGDKSPKAIEQKKKQAEAEKLKKQQDAYTKSHPAPGGLGPRSK